MYEFRVSPENPYHISAGAVVYKEEDGEHKFALLYHDYAPEGRDRRWSLPKGTMHNTETLEETVLREVREETGLVVELEKYIGAGHAQFTLEENGWGVDRTIHYFVARMTGGDPADMDDEHDGLEWFTAEEAKLVLIDNPIKQEQRFIERAEAYLSTKQQ